MDLDLVLTVALAAYLLICALFGLIRGSRKSLFRLITVVLSACFAFIAVIIFKNTLGDEALTEQINSLLAQNGMESIVDIAASSPLLEEIILKTAGGLVAPIVFFVAFVAFSIVTYILYFLITLILRIVFKKKKRGCLGGILAMVFGIVQGLVVVGALVLTVISYTLIVPEVAPKLEASESLDESSKQGVLEVCDAIEKINDTTVISAYSNIGLKAAAGALTSYEIETETETLKIKMNDEISSIADLFLTYMELSSSPMNEYGEAEAILIQKFGKSFTDSKLLSLAGAELLHNATAAWKNGEPFAGIEKPALGDDMDPLLTKLIEIFNESTKTQATFKEDIITVADLVAALAKNGVFAATADTENENALFDCLAKDGVISAITLPLNSNERMRALIPEITNLGLKTLASSLGIATNTEELYREALSNIAAHIESTKGETDNTKRPDTLKPLLKTEFDNLGVTVDDKYLGDLSVALIEDFGDFEGDITPEFIAEFFDIYSNTVSDGDTEEGGTVPTAGSASATVKPLGASAESKYTFDGYKNGDLSDTGASKAAGKSRDHIESDSTSDEDKENFQKSFDILSAMRSSSTAQINRATVADLLVSSAINLSDPTAESAALERIVREVVALMNALSASDSNGVETLKEFSARLGDALDTLAGTEMYGSDRTFKLFAAILQSKTVRDATNISVPETIRISNKHREKSEKVSFGSLMNVIGSTVDIISSMQNSDLKPETITGLVENLTPENAEVIKEVLTEERMTDMGIPEEKAKTTTEILGTLFDELGKVDSEEAENETKAVENIINLGITAMGGSGDGESKSLFNSASSKPSEGTGSEGEEGSEGGEGSSSSENNGTLGCTADEMVDNIMSSTAVTNTINSVADNGTEDPFGVSGSLSDEDAEAVNSACDEYIKNNVSEDTTDEEKAEMEKTLENIKKLLGITSATSAE